MNWDSTLDVIQIIRMKLHWGWARHVPSHYSGWLRSGQVLSIPHRFLHKQQMPEKLHGLTWYIIPPSCCPPSPIHSAADSILCHSKSPCISLAINLLPTFSSCHTVALSSSNWLGLLPIVCHPTCCNICHHNAAAEAGIRLLELSFPMKLRSASRFDSNTDPC